MKKYLLLYILLLFCGCDPVHKYIIYNNYYDDVSVKIERSYKSKKILNKDYNIKFKDKIEENFFDHSFKIIEQHLPSQILVYYNNKKCFTYDKKWLIEELKNKKLYGKSYLFLILGENGLFPVSYKEYMEIVKKNLNNQNVSYKMTNYDIKNKCIN